MPVILAIANQKGGVGRTTVTLNLGAALAERERRVLLIDLNPQADLSFLLNIESGAHRMIQDLLLKPGEDNSAAILQTQEKGLNAITASRELVLAEQEVCNPIGQRATVLSTALARIPEIHSYHYVLIDCPGRLGGLNTIALAASDQVLVVLRATNTSVIGLERTQDEVEHVRQHYNPRVKMMGALLNQYQKRAPSEARVRDDVKLKVNGALFEAVISFTNQVEKAEVARCSVVRWAPKSKAANEFRTLAEEVEARAHVS